MTAPALKRFRAERPLLLTMFDLAVTVTPESAQYTLTGPNDALAYSVIAKTEAEAIAAARADAEDKHNMVVDVTVVESRPTDGHRECNVCEGEEGHSCKFCWGTGLVPLSRVENFSEPFTF